MAGYTAERHSAAALARKYSKSLTRRFFSGKFRLENLNNDESCVKEIRPPGRRAGSDRDRRVRGGGHGGRRLVHQELRPVQEDVGRLLRGVAVRGRLCQVQGQDDTGLREHRFRGTVSQQTRITILNLQRTNYIILLYTYEQIIMLYCTLQPYSRTYGKQCR